MRNGGTTSNPDETSGLTAARMLQIHQQVSEGDGFTAAAAALCAGVAQAVGASRVSLAWQHAQSQQVELVAVSNAPVAALNTELRNSLLAAADEAMFAQCSVHSLGQHPSGAITAAQRALAHQSGGSVLSVPMALDNQAVGALCVEMPAATLPPASAQSRQRLGLLISFLEHLLAPCSRLLRLNEQTDEPVHRLLWARLLRQARNTRPAARRRRRWLLAGAIGVAVGLLIPFEQPISSQAHLEGAIEREITAPVDGFLESVQVRPGDIVQAGQLLATLRTDELELERNQLQADLAQHQVAVNAAMVSNDRSTMATARAQIDQANARIALLDMQIAQADIRAPMAAPVLHGDLIERLNMPVTRGEALFTLAPDDSLRVLIEVDENDIAQVHIGQRGQLAPSALPWDRIDIEVNRVAPVASVIDGRNVVPVHARLIGSTHALKSGQRGTVHLPGPRQNLLTRWAGDLLDALARQWWRWQPW